MDKNPWKSLLNAQLHQEQPQPDLPSETGVSLQGDFSQPTSVPQTVPNPFSKEQITRAERIFAECLGYMKEGRLRGMVLFTDVTNDAATGESGFYDGRFFADGPNYGLIGYAQAGLNELATSWITDDAVETESDDNDVN